MSDHKQSIKAILIPLIIIVLLVSGCSSKKTSTSESVTGEVTESNMTNTVETSGTVSARQLATLNWGTSGNVMEVKVSAGDQVKTDDVLMSLDSTSAPSDVNEAISELVTAKEDLETAKNSNTALAQAEVALATAKDSYYQALGYYYTLGKPVGSDDYNAILKKNVIDAQEDVEDAQDQYANYAEYADDDPAKIAVRAKLGQANIALKEAKSIYNYYVSAPNTLDSEAIVADLNLAKSQLDDAQRDYDQLKDGSNTDAITSAQAAVDAAQATVNLLYIIAPFDGEIAVVYSQVGDVVSAGTEALALVDRSEMYIDVSVDETSISSVELGDSAEITFDALGISTTGKVTRIDPIGTTSNGVVNYTVRVTLDKSDEKILIGSTATVVITTGEPQSVLFVPVAAVQSDAQGEYVIRVKNDGSTERVTVVSGQIVDETVIVVGDLAKGDKVQLNSSSSSSSTETEQTQQQGGGMPAGGGEMPAGGGEMPAGGGGGGAPMP